MRLSNKDHVTGSNITIDDILLYSTSLSLLILLFECYTDNHLDLQSMTLCQNGLSLLGMISYLLVILWRV